MTPPRNAAGSRKGPAARREAKNKAPEIKFKGLKLVLPEKLPASALPRLWRVRDNNAKDAIQVLETLIGRSNLDQVLDKLDADGAILEEEDSLTFIGELITEAFGVYGVNLGESKASESS